VNIIGAAGHANSLTINTLNDDGMIVACHSNGCSGSGIGGNGWVWSGITTIDIRFGNGDDVAQVTDLGVTIPQTMTLNGGGGTDLFSVVADVAGFSSFQNGQLILLDSLLDGSPSDGTATLDVDMCKFLHKNCYSITVSCSLTRL
jgi:hypothetical protein